MTTIKEARRILKENFGMDDDPGHVTFSKGLFTVHEGYFYRHGRSEEDLAHKVLEVLPEAKIIDSGDHYANFNGGASIRRSSHFWVKVRLVYSK